MTGLIGPIFFTQTFAYFVRSDSASSTFLELSGSSFILAFLLLLCAAVIAWLTTKTNPDESIYSNRSAQG